MRETIIELELCPKCKSDYLKPIRDEPRKLTCHFCGKTEVYLTLKQIEDMKRRRTNLEFCCWIHKVRTVDVGEKVLRCPLCGSRRLIA